MVHQAKNIYFWQCLRIFIYDQFILLTTPSKCCFLESVAQRYKGKLNCPITHLALQACLGPDYLCAHESLWVANGRNLST